jgi:hypothetical protein
MHVLFGVTLCGLLDSTTLHINSMSEWMSSIISPGNSIGIPLMNHLKFPIFAAVACDILWFYRNKAFHDGASFNVILVSKHINKISLGTSKLGNHLLQFWRTLGFLLLSIGSK